MPQNQKRKPPKNQRFVVGEKKNAEMLLLNYFWDKIPSQKQVLLGLTVLLTTSAAFYLSSVVSKNNEIVSASTQHVNSPFNFFQRSTISPEIYGNNFQWIDNIKFNNHQELYDKIQVEFNQKGHSLDYNFYIQIVNEKIDLLKKILRNLMLNQLEKTILSETKFVIGPLPQKHIARTYTDSGDVWINLFAELNEKDMTAAIKNELHHLRVRYINIKRYGVNFPKDTKAPIVVYPFIKEGWNIDMDQRNEFKSIIDNGIKKVISIAKILKMGPKNVLPEDKATIKEFFLVASKHNRITQDEISSNDSAFILIKEMVAIVDTINSYPADSLETALIEAASLIDELNFEVKDYFFKGFIEYMDAYLDMDYPDYLPSLSH